MGAWLGPLLGMAAGAASSFLGAKDNEKARDETRQMNAEQRNWEEAMWNKQNDYNNPARQMERLKAAGINPNAAFGNGATTLASAPSTSRPAPLPAPNSGAVLGGAIDRYFDTSGQTLQKDLVETQIASLIQKNAESAAKTFKTLDVDIPKTRVEIEAKQAGIANTEALTDRTRTGNQMDAFNYNQAQSLSQTSIDFQKEKLREIQLNNTMQALENSFLPKQQQMLIAESITRIRAAEATMSYQEVQKALEKEKLNLRERGVETGDSWILRYLQGAGWVPSPKEMQKVTKGTNQLSDKLRNLRR